MGWQLRHTSNAYNRTCRWSKCDSRHVVYCLSGGRKSHAEVLTKSVAQTAVVQRCQILWHTRELWEWWQGCWKSCSWAFNRSLQPGVETWYLQVDLHGPSRSLKTSAHVGSCAGDCSCRLSLGHRGEMSRTGFL